MLKKPLSRFAQRLIAENRIKQEEIAQQKKAQDDIEGHRKTVFAAGEPSETLSEGLGVLSVRDYSEGDIL